MGDAVEIARLPGGGNCVRVAGVCGANGRRKFDVPVRELASELGVTAQTVHNAFSALSASNYVDVDGTDRSRYVGRCMRPQREGATRAS